MKKIVVKIGSSVIAPAGKLDFGLVRAIVDDILEAEDLGYETVVVSSGAIACGLNQLGLAKKPQEKSALMALASLGQIILMDAYSRELAKRGRFCGQILLSWDDFDSRKRFLNASSTLRKLLDMDIIPVINENDAVSDDEIKFGDNDRLSALTADLVGADTLIILSDVAGLLGERGQVIKQVPCVDEAVYKLVKKKSGALTAGGMTTKLQAAEIVTNSGIKMVIASGKERMAISRICRGEELGTAFLPASKVSAARKRWIAFSKKVKGRIYLDDGASDALLNKGRSLLGVGIIKVEGEFKKKDSVCVMDAAGRVIGCGLSNYSSDELCGCREKKLAKEVIHRDNFVKQDR